MGYRLARWFNGTLLLLAFPAALHSQERYRDPSPVITRILDAPRTPRVVVSPDRARFLFLEPATLQTDAVTAASEIPLAGVRINPRTNALSRAPTYVSLVAVPLSWGETRRIIIPWQAHIGSAFWSPDGKRIAYTLVEDAGVSLWVGDPADGVSRLLAGPVLNAARGNPCGWLPSSEGLICSRVPAGRAGAPADSSGRAVPVQGTASGQVTDPRYEDLLRSPHDEALFEHYFTDQLVLISINGAARPIGVPGIHSKVEISPDGKYLLVETLRRPYSYRVPYQRFAARTEVWDLAGSVVRQVADRPLQEDAARSADRVTPGPRAIGWRDDAPATLVWTEALDGGDPGVDAPVRDRIQLLAAPFTGEPTRLVDLQYRARNVIWGRANLAIVREGWQRARRSATWVIDPSHPGTAPRRLFDRSSEDRYGHPGSFVTRPGEAGRQVLLTTKDGRFAFLAGAGASAAGDQPFLDRLELSTGATQRLWRSQPPYYEEVAEILDPDAGRVLTRRESVTEPPNYFVRDLRNPAASRLTQLTRFTDPAPEFAGVTRQLLTYRRADGLQLSATLYLPAGYDRSKGPLPFILWAHPREFLDAGAASQVTGSPYRFIRPSGTSHLFLLLQGYGVLDSPSMPILTRPGKSLSDTAYVQQLVASAKAAVDKVVAMGVADPKRIAVGGPARGAPMTADLLAHSNLFRAGIAQSGGYDRTLASLGWGTEEQNTPGWEGEQTSAEMPLLSRAGEIDEPILFLQEIADDEFGTLPIQSERGYAAAPDATPRPVAPSPEVHGYRARELVGQTLSEMVQWLDRYVKRTVGPATP